MNYQELNSMLSKFDDIPFPEVKYVVKNPMYANLLYDNLSGDFGELSAVTQYVYEHMDMIENLELSSIMLKIAIQEMRHLNLVGELIKRLGKTPCFINSKGQNWNSSFLNYNIENIVKTMEHNIKTEKIAIDGYNKAIRYTRNQDIRKLFSRIILDEKNHIEVFTRIIENVQKINDK